METRLRLESNVEIKQVGEKIAAPIRVYIYIYTHTHIYTCNFVVRTVL